MTHIVDSVPVMSIRTLSDIVLQACRPDKDYHLFVVPGPCLCGDLRWQDRNRDEGQVLLIGKAAEAAEACRQ